jgi:hypothetical protein
MASGDQMAWIHPWSLEAPSTGMYTRNVRNNHPVAEFADAVDQTGFSTRRLPGNYGGGGLTVTLSMMSTATANVARFEVSIERIDAGTLDTDADSFATAKIISITTSGTSGIVTTGSVSFSSGAEMDSLAAGEQYRFKIMRDGDGTGGTDSMTAAAQITGIWITET